MELIKKIKPYVQPKTVAAVLMLLVCVIGGGVIAKYIYQNKGNELVYAQEFYFTSDLLDGETHTLAPGTDTISFTVGNHGDRLRYSEMDITYEVTVSEDGSNSTTAKVEYGSQPVTTVDADGNTVSSEHILETGKVNDATITLSGLENGKTYTVTATANGGYHKTLTTKLIVQSDTPMVYKYLENSSDGEYITLTVWSIGNPGNVKITYPTTVAPDNTDAVMREWKSSDGSTGREDNISFNSGNTEDGYTSHVYRFFGKVSDTSGFDAKYYIGEEEISAETKKPE